MEHSMKEEAALTIRDPHEFLAEQALAIAARWSKQCDELRANAAGWGKGVLTLGTVVVGGFGLSNVTQIFPVEGHLAWVYASLGVAALVLMGISAVALARIQSRASRSIVMSPDLDEMRDRRPDEGSSGHSRSMRLHDNSFTEAELAEIEQIYGRFAELNRPVGFEGAYTTKMYNEIALAIERQAESTDELIRAEGLSRLARAAQIRAEVYATQMKAMAAVVRMRVIEATSGAWTVMSLVLFVVSLIGVVMFSSFAANTRSTHSDSLEHVKLCAETAKALREAADRTLPQLPDTCRGQDAVPAT
jgi:hypothetical protein